MLNKPSNKISILFVSSPFRFKTLFTKPLKYIIQIATGNSAEHAASYCDDYVLNVGGKGIELIKYEDWIKEFAINGAKIHCIELINSPNNICVEDLSKYNKSCIGKKYDTIGAIISPFDNIKLIRNLDHNSNSLICSEQALNGLVRIGLLDKQKDTPTPIELKKILLKSPNFCNKWRRLN